MAGIRKKAGGHLNYHKNEIMNMSPAQLVLKLFDFAILGCKLKDSLKVSKALVELISALSFEKNEIAIGLFKLYQYCLDVIKKEQFDEALKIITELRSTWMIVIKENQSSIKNIARIL